MPATSTHRRPESVLVLVYTGGGDVLLLKRHQPFAFWQSVTGSLEPGEDHRRAARRELTEETGFTNEGELYFSGNKRIFEIDPRWRHRYGADDIHNTEYEWRYRLASAEAIRIDRAEHAGYCWMPLANAVDAVWSWTNREALQSLRIEL
ncbi:MAG: dihydroneopterin triphosphate diphosphatase [Woeseia sp.]